MSVSRHDGGSDDASELEPTAMPETPSSDAQQGRSKQSSASSVGVAGERGIPSVNRVRSMQSRVSSALAIGLMAVIGLGFLGWYYSHALGRGERVQANAERATRERAQTEMIVPPLGPIQPPRVVPPDTSVEPETSWMEHAMGEPPPMPGGVRWRAAQGFATETSHEVAGSPDGAAHPASVDRRLTGAVLIGRSRAADDGRAPVLPTPRAADVGQEGDLAVTAGRSTLEHTLTPSVLPATEARVLPSRHLLLSKGTAVDCTLITAIDTSLEGIVTCVTATDTFSADGRVVLIERGSTLVGETRGEVRQGNARVFVLWGEARTPNGIVVPLESPGTDALGRSGLPGYVHRHFVERFGAAILVSVIDGAVQAASQSQRGNGSVLVQPSTSSGVLTDVLRQTIGIPPTVLVHQGDRVQILAARDVDFRRIYELRLTRQ
ncbi:TrbI/VirB10 family protein [Peristeroidobacter soli]|uniref:TrbI/VirB10 family protein n=1 Tax=Peristeroidobacter soli TaxID=2497877 RepID=UPI00101C0190|nr:TrbI/VirB10 family protein [Peristeroidobacter soli]